VAADVAALDVTRPINAYVIEHAKGLILFDDSWSRPPGRCSR
jgi:hypothetical protein